MNILNKDSVDVTESLFICFFIFSDRIFAFCDTLFVIFDLLFINKAEFDWGASVVVCLAEEFFKIAFV